MSDIIPVRVALRIRPLSSKEIENGCDTALDKIPGRAQVSIRNSEKAFTYDYAYGTDANQSDIYRQSVEPLIAQLFKGYNATVLAYGQTGSGKTFSMGTSNREDETPIHLEGVIPRAVREIFEKIEENTHKYDFCVRVAFVELYKEKLYDLLSTASKIKEDCMVDLREDPVKGVVINNLTEVVVKDLRSTMGQLEQGSIKRVTAATAMNNTSSRSHAIFTIFIEGTRKSEDSDAENIVAKFHLVDLAGSERAKKTLATGVRYKEGVAINLGLLALGNVISALGDDSGTKHHIPYRDSKLTRLLQDSLGGNSHTLMIACVSPADTNLEETISTLRYADRARKIKNKPIVNQDGKDAENAKLRREIAELRVQLLNGGGGGNFSPKDLDELKAKNTQLTSENRELTSALMSCQDELSHMNEKLLLTEDSNIKLKTKLEELAAEAKRIQGKNPLDSDGDNLFRKIMDVLDVQKDSEKSLADHDISRYDTAQSLNASDASEVAAEIGATELLKQNALASQLASLNKQLAQKEQYAIVLNQQEEKLKEVRLKYEEQLNQMELQMKGLEKEKDHLNQQNRAEPVTSKLSEQRRKRIQELEAQMSDLKKKLTEQQRMIAMNKKNEQKLKTLSEEIKNMKQAKVRLIRQMKEDAEKVRTWKIQKEKEVNQLKQAERKQQAQMTKMNNLHSKQQNVLKRKMEEAVAVNKRLKDVIDKQKAAKKMNTGKKGLAGAAERMRNLVSQELDVVVSVKEAKQSREQLLKDRTNLSKQLADLKRQTRVTMTNNERDQMHNKIKELEDELALQNAQISELQKQILDADVQENEEKSANAKWWDTLSTMTEAKIALQYLFEKAAESMATSSNSQSAYNEIKVLYNEAIKNTEALEEEITNLKDEHEEEMVEHAKDYEERLFMLLNQLTSKNPDVEIKDSDIQKFSKLQEVLMQMHEDFDSKRSTKMVKKYNPPQPKTPRMKIEEFFSDEDSSDEDLDKHDPEWYKTPLIKRIRKIRANIHNNSAGNKRKLGETFDGTPEPEQDQEKENDGPTKAKRISSSGCGCKTNCGTGRCKCRKIRQICSDECRCSLQLCKNRENSDDKSVLSDVSNNTTAGTMSLLNDTYQIPLDEEPKFRKITPPSINVEEFDESSSPKKRHRESLFKSPFGKESPGDMTPSYKRQNTMFKSPIREEF